MFNQGTFKNYVDQSSPNLDPNPPRVDKNVQCAYQLPFVLWPTLDFPLTLTPLFLSTYLLNVHLLDNNIIVPHSDEKKIKSQ